MKIKEFVMPKRLDLDYIQATLSDWLNIESYNIENDDGTVTTLITNYYDRAILACLNLVKYYGNKEDVEELVAEITNMEAKALTDIYYKLIKINGWAVLEKAYEQENYVQCYNKRMAYNELIEEIHKLENKIDETNAQIEEDDNIPEVIEEDVKG